MRQRTPVLLLVVALLMLVATAQQRASAHEGTFTSPDGSFRFSYPSDFEVCTKGKIQPCIQSFIPVCEDDALVCVVFPAQEFKDTNFGAASLQVREIYREESMTSDVCVTPYPRKDGGTASNWPEFLLSAEHPSKEIGGIRFMHGINGGGATSHAIGTDLYRTLHNGRCFELSISETTTEPHVTDPPMKTLTPAQQKELDQTMSDILNSFRFTN